MQVRAVCQNHGAVPVASAPIPQVGTFGLRLLRRVGVVDPTIAAFFRDESCGQCVPCRVGTVRQEEMLHRLCTGHTLGTLHDELALHAELGQVMRDASICGLGHTAANAIASALPRLPLFPSARHS